MSNRAKNKRKLPREFPKHYALDNKLSLDIKHFNPLTSNQETVFKQFTRKHLFLHGSAGTGKSFIAIYLALKEIFSSQSPFKKLIIVRSLVQTRDMGHLPGSDKDKMKVYEAPYIPICAELFGRSDAYTVLKQKGIIEFMSTSFIRGITLEDSIVLVDECQNLTSHEMHSVMTRIGNYCKIVFAGDIRQTDLNKRKEYSGICDFIKIIQQMNCFEFIEFNEDDIVRSQLVKNYIITKNRLEDDGTIKEAIV
jgi:phosphate starvation-inducible PhoH-like protein